jgi:hypothetical protein
MYSIFHPLDPNERLPRELIVEGRRYRFLDRGFVLTLVGVLYLPALILAVIVLGSSGLGMVAGFAVAGVALLAVYLYVISTRSA